MDPKGGGCTVPIGVLEKGGLGAVVKPFQIAEGGMAALTTHLEKKALKLGQRRTGKGRVFRAPSERGGRLGNRTTSPRGAESKIQQSLGQGTPVGLRQRKKGTWANIAVG